jgi:NADH:ubiquinone oxidoreductase subunit 5 (subunit L)/multisubunit Na+/H+ antiporter MnhA subunit
MTLPLIVLAILTVCYGRSVGIPSEHGTRFARFLAPVFHVHEAAHGGLRGALYPVLAVSCLVRGFAWPGIMYMPPDPPPRSGSRSRACTRCLLNAYYVDALYDRVIVRPLLRAVGVPGACVRPARGRRARQRGGPHGGGHGQRDAADARPATR